jgi:hypothetical protein
MMSEIHKSVLSYSQQYNIQELILRTGNDSHKCIQLL